MRKIDTTLTFEERCALEAAERQERYAALLGLAREVAANMGGIWTAREHENSEGNAHLDSYRGDVYIVNPDGRRLTLTINQHSFDLPKRGDTIAVSGTFNYGDSSLGIGFPYDKKRPEITVNRTRGAAVIAREIERRFLPNYNALHLEILKRVEAATEYRDKQEGITARLAALAGAEPKRTNKRGFGLRAGEGNSRYVEVKVSSGEVDIKVENLTESEAGEVLRLLAPYLAKRKDG